ncbi:AEC family transporter [Pararhodonellum marinum]|uniref:permease n=1 Tax=Pararhodonellum marinum TaxID=2755358 RepID=UPI001E54C0BA|nr:permease [Pararhodonellum marinum]
MAVQKTLALLLLLVIGLLLRKKLSDPAQLKGLKTLILTVALPAIIFVALLKAEVHDDLFYLPLMALAFNGLLYLILRLILPFFGLEKDHPKYRTYLLLFPSLAPGLSCFPFLIEYLGDDALAWGALADIGNKVFVLIMAYLLAMSWFLKNHPGLKTGKTEKMKSLMLSLINEPINLVIFLALVLLTLGIHMDDLPPFLSAAILNLSYLMTPLVLIYIGLAVVFNWKQIGKITGLLLVRSGLTFWISAAFILLMPGLPAAGILLLVVFPQSAISFWPFAHMSAIAGLEKKLGTAKNKSTFDLELAVNMLAVSLPFSTLIMLLVFSFGETFASPTLLVGVGFVMLLLGTLSILIRWLQSGIPEVLRRVNGL